jgi:hypothetical protein
MFFSKHILFLSLFFFLIIFISLPAITQETDDPVLNDPAASITGEELMDPALGQRFTNEEFSRLPDEEKKNIYFNFPYLLPEDFSFDLYMHIFYPEFEETEN